ncbi:MAG: CAP domain-containing protein [Actinomycetota bacterium]|nr:CAP domain-containing protein [Actinomycetota bacterium]
MTSGAPTLATARSVKALLGLALAALVLSGCWGSNASTFLQKTNYLRASKGVPALAPHGTLDGKAQSWADTIASKGTLVHSNLSDGMSSVNWYALGENLASGAETGDWASRLHDALVASPTHHANLVDRRFTHMGVGVASAGGKVYVVEVFAEIR